MSSYNKQIINNSIFSAIQIVVVSISVFFLYKYIIEVLGIEKLGLWSLILSVTSLASIGNFGFTGSLVKFTAELSVGNNFKKINAILNSSIICVGIFLAVLFMLIYFLGYNFIGFFVDYKWISISRTLLSFALTSLYINIIASLYFSILEGLNLAYLRAISFITATIIYVVLSVIFIKSYDLLGLAYAQVCQALIFLILGIVLTKRFAFEFNIFYLKWHKNLMKKVFNYGMSFQLIGIAQILYDPITKAILSKYGGLNYVAIFEMASKLVIQVRAISAGIIQNIVPKIVKLNTVFGKEKIINAYKKINNINLFLIFSTLILIIPFSNIISILLLGHSEQKFIIILIITCTGWAINALNISSYMINLGTGDLRWNVISHLTIGFLNLFFCLLIGYFYRNGVYIILSWIFALILGSSLIIAEYHRRNKISFHFIFNKVFYQLLGFYLLLLIASYFINKHINNLILLITVECILILIYYYFVVFKIKEVKNNIYFIYQTKKQNNLN